MRTSFFLVCATLIGAATLPACSVIETPRTQRGNKIDPDQLKELVVGTSTKADATSLLGSPTARATFDDNTWIYINETTKPIIGGTQRIRDQQVVVLTFDQGGVLRNIEKRGQSDSQDVAVSSGATPSPGNNASVLQQLLGNVGRFSPGGNTSGQKQNTTGGTGGANSF